MLALFVGASVLLHLAHEAWRDEGQAWLIARDSPDLVALFRQLGYEGSPGLWHLMLYPLARLGLPFWTMATLSGAVATASAALVIFRAPFSLTERSLATFGYFMLYRYNVVARSYVLSVLLLLLVAQAYPNRLRRPVTYGLLVGVLANTNVHSALIALALGVAYIIEVLHRPEGRSHRCVAFSGPLVIGLALALYQMLPPPDLRRDLLVWHVPPTAAHTWNTARLVLANSFFPLAEALSPRFGLLSAGWLNKSAAVGLVCFLGVVAALGRTTSARLIFVASALMLMVVFCCKYQGAVWHHGLLFILFLALLWIARESELPRKDAGDPRRSDLRQALFEQPPRPGGWVVLGILACQFVAAWPACYRDVTQDYSAGRRVAAFVEREGLLGEGALVCVFPCWLGAAVLPYINDARARLYYAEYDGFGSFTTWSTALEESAAWPLEEPASRLQAAAQRLDAREAVLIAHRGKAWQSGHPPEGWELLASFGRTVTDEAFSIYALRAGTHASQ